MKSFVVIGQSAVASDEFLIDDVPGTSGRLDALIRCVRAALLVSHDVRRDASLYLVLQGGPRAERTVRIDGAAAKFLRPDERSGAVLLKKMLATTADQGRNAFVYLRQGIAVAGAGIDAVLGDVGRAVPYVLEEGAPDLRDDAELGKGDAVFFLGDHLGFHPAMRERLAAIGARPVSVGPVALHTEDVIAIVSNELDRRGR